MKVSTRSNVPSFVAMDVMATAALRHAAGEDVFRLEVGQPGTPGPATALEAAKRAIDTDLVGYTDPLGIEPLRNRIAQFYTERYDVKVDPARIVVTAGSSVGFILAFLAAFEKNDRIALSIPFYPPYPNIAKTMGLQPVLVRANEEHRFQISPDLMNTLENISGFVAASPANPTGSMLSPDEVAGLVDYAEGKKIWMISDEIYHGITFAQPAQTALAFSDDVIVLNSFSKYFSMPGWRIGWMVVPGRLIDPLRRLMQNLYISTHAVSQFAALGAFEGTAELDRNVEVYVQNRQVLLDALPKMGIKPAFADGAFYIYADVSKYTNDSKKFCERILADTGLAITPGIDFDPQQGGNFIRISYAGPADTIAEAVSRLGKFLANN